MTFSSSFRRRWGRWFGLLAVACSAAYWAERRFDGDDKTKPAEEADLPEPELAPTLIQAHELPTVTAGPISSKSPSGWDPQPLWRFELSGSLKEQSQRVAADYQSTAPIPEAFPLPPRFKKGPPVVGDAVVDPFANFDKQHAFDPIRQPRHETPVAGNTSDADSIASSPTAGKKRHVISSTSVTTFSPFETSSRSDKPAERHSPTDGLAATSTPIPMSATAGPTSTLWPDQTFSPPSAQTTIAAETPSPLNAVVTPNLLTNARIERFQAGPSATVNGYAPQPSVAPIHPSNPASGSYILQPKK